MTANKAKFALTLSLALVLAACGGGGGGGGNDDDDGGGNSSRPPPAGAAEFDGTFTLWGTNRPADPFNRTLTADFNDGAATVGSGSSAVATEFRYPLNAQTGGCYYAGGAIDHCVERAQGQVLALCTDDDDNEISAVGIRADAQATIASATVQEMADAALARTDDRLELRAVDCANGLNANDTVTIGIDGSAVQRVGSSTQGLTPTNVALLFGNAGITTSNPPAQVGSKAYKHTVNGVTTFYVVNFGSAETTQGGNFPPLLFVSVD